MIEIRIATKDDYRFLPAIEYEASKLFTPYRDPSEAVVDIEALSENYYLSLPKNSIIYVATNDQDKIVGFAVGKCVDNNAYLNEVDVLPDYGKKGIGKQLVNAIIDWAKQKQYEYITLTTFLAVPFNAPFYAKMGFKELKIDNVWPELYKIREQEKQDGLDINKRIAMIKSL